ncbi:O-antigen ligase family protein [Marinobacter sp. DUT-1]|uniref:O-antigen ligase family protein n=1 Tax=Marinobacter sp. DUT-1 TaxID=3412037 RepID=UPI003D1805DF
MQIRHLEPQARFRTSFAPHPVSNRVSESKLLVFATCTYIIAWYLQVGLRVPILGAIRFEFVLGSILSFCAIIKLIREPFSTPLAKPVMIFIFVLSFYTIFSYDRSQSWEIFIERVIKFSMLAAFLAAFVRTEWALKMVVGAFLLAMLKLGQEGFVGWYSGGMIWQNQGIPRLHGVTPLYRHPNSYSGMAVGCLPFIFYLFPIAKKWQKLLLILLFFFCAIIIIYTGSRTGYVATALLGLYFWREKLEQGKIKYVAVGVAIILIIYILLPEAYIGRMISIFTMEEAEGSSSEARLQIIKDSFSVFVSHPWGIGVAAFPSVRMEMFNRFQDTHNLYLEILTNLSLPGLIAFFFLIYKIIKTNGNIIINTDNKFIKALSRAIIAFIYARLFLGMFGMDTYEIYWWFAVGLTIANFRVFQNSKNKRQYNKNHSIKEPLLRFGIGNNK